MGRFVPLVYGVLSAVYLLGVAAQDIPDCIPQCSNQLRGEFPKFSCQSAEDAACLCGKIDFSYGVRDCAAPCGSTDELVRRYLSGAFCQGQALPPLPSSSSSSRNSQSTSKPSSSKSATAQVSSSPSSTSSEQVSSTTEQDSSTAIASSTEGAQATSDSSSSVSASSTTSAAVANAATSSAAAGGGSSGLSRGAAAGIGVGAGIGGIALALLAFGLFLKCRRRKTDKPVDISKPLPRGATKANGAPQIASDRPVGDIEMTSTRYEDMVPRQQPRTMI